MAKKYDKFRIRLASPDEIRGWSYGEVLKHETINYRTLKAERDGLFCEVIFGPTKDYQCACGKSKRHRMEKGTKCDKCGVEITESKVRRERMGHIELAAPVVHTWYLRSTSSKLALLLNMKVKDLELVVYLAAYIVIDAGKTPLTNKQILSEAEYSQYSREYFGTFKALTGAEAVKTLLKEINLEKEKLQLKIELKTASKQKRDKIMKRLEIVQSFSVSDNKPEWMVLDVLPVIPPDIRPMVQLDGGRFATTDLNDLYRRILNRNNRLKKQFKQSAPHLITKNEKRMLQEAVDALIDNGKRGRKVVVERNRPLKSLSDMLRGKQGRFRQNLLGKRVDYSGRSVIVVGPNLEMYQCGIPKEMGLTLFKPFVIRELINLEITQNIKSAKAMIELHDDRVWAILEKVIKEHPILLNRAPTLHRLGIQAFEPKLVEGKAIRLHPLVTPAFNADFDGDQMAVHVPLSVEAQAEARMLMLASNNILNPKDGKPVVTPSQDMVLGNYYVTMETKGLVGEGKVFRNSEEAIIALENKIIELHTKIAVKGSGVNKHSITKEQGESYLVTTVGKIIFNDILPSDFPYLNEPSNQNLKGKLSNKYFIPQGQNVTEIIKAADKVEPFNKKFLGTIISEIFSRYKISETSRMLDRMKDLGFLYSTVAGITVSASDVKVYTKKKDVLSKSEQFITSVTKLYNKGLLTDKERYNLVIKEWAQAKDIIQKGLMNELEEENHIFMMADSGARGNSSNFTQLAGMRGLMANPSGGIIELPIKSAFREGLTMSEFFISTHGARKGSTDTALKTAESGYLTRRLVDVSQDVIITTDDCKTEKGQLISELKDKDGKIIETLYDRIVGRYLAKDIKENGLTAKRNDYIDENLATSIVEADIEAVTIRNTFNCDAKVGICKFCYGKNLATGHKVEVGEAVGIIAAQSIGEPGTQLTMRTFHTGGVAGDDITQGLPRIQELFEARNPKGKAMISEIDGSVQDIQVLNGRYEITVANKIEEKVYLADSGSTLAVEKNQDVIAGQGLTEGSIAPKELIKVASKEKVENYILSEVQKIYRSQGVEISDKHVEIIIRQMLQKILITDEGTTKLLPGSEVSILQFKEANEEVIKSGGRLAKGRSLLLGITAASLRSESFLSAASFQETTRILTDAAIRGASDPLIGLKENVIIGGLIPAGTGVLKTTKFDYERPVIEEEIELDELENLENNEEVKEVEIKLDELI